MTEKTLPMDPRQINSPQSFGEFLQEQNAMGQFTTVVVDPRNIFFDSFPDQETADILLTHSATATQSTSTITRTGTGKILPTGTSTSLKALNTLVNLTTAV